MKSWDLFDTIIARKCIHPHKIFEEIESKYKINRFKEFRIRSEQYDNILDVSYDSIYQKYKMHSKVSDEEINKLKKIEIDVEANNLFLIKEVYNKVSDGDILVSDMYHTPETIRYFLDKVGYTKNTKIYVSSGGKSHGYIWDKIKKDNPTMKIDLHSGDSMNSDVNMPKKYNIPTQHINVAECSEIENFLIQNGFIDLARIIRVVRLSNPYIRGDREFIMWYHQSQYNLPILFLTAMITHNTAKSGNVHNFLFATRDCCYLYKIFQILYNDTNYNITYYDSSRHIFWNPTIQYDNYVLDLIRKAGSVKNMLYIDITGSGRSPSAYFNHLNDTYQVGMLNKLIFFNDIMFEYYNCDTIGTLIGFDDNGAIREPLKYPLETIKPYTDCVDLFLSLLKTDVDMKSTNNISNDTIWQTITPMAKNLMSFMDIKKYVPLQ